MSLLHGLQDSFKEDVQGFYMKLLKGALVAVAAIALLVGGVGCSNPPAVSAPIGFSMTILPATVVIPPPATTATTSVQYLISGTAPYVYVTYSDYNGNFKSLIVPLPYMVSYGNFRASQFAVVAGVAPGYTGTIKVDVLVNGVLMESKSDNGTGVVNVYGQIR